MGEPALKLAEDGQPRVRGLVLLSTFHTLVGHPGVKELGAAVAAMRDPVDPAFVRAFQAKQTPKRTRSRRRPLSK